MRNAVTILVCYMSICFLAQGCYVVASKGILTVYDKQTQKPLHGATASLHVRYVPRNPWGDPRYEKQPLEENPPATFRFSYPTYPVRDASIGVGKNGYYSASVSLSNVEKTEGSTRLGLSPKLNPVSLIAVNWLCEDMLLTYTPNGNLKQYDCLKTDWLPPNGKGVQADMEFSLQRYRQGEKTFAWFKIRFINPNDGFEEIKENYAQGMRIREAPATKKLQNQLDFVEELYEGRPRNVPPLKDYAFRVRTQQTPSGEILSAYYGKLYNAFTFNYAKNNWRCEFEYYLNPTPNDRNLEYNGHSINKPKERINEIRWVR